MVVKKTEKKRKTKGRMSNEKEQERNRENREYFHE
jgi:hypothetical protein